MPKYTITAPDGTVYNVETPEGVTEDQALSQVQSIHGAEPDLVQQIGTNLRAIPRQLGLTARHVLEGAGQAVDLPTGPLAATENAISRAVAGPNAPQAEPWSQAFSQAADALGLPRPATPTERVVGDVARTMAGTAALGGAGAAGSELPGTAGLISRALAANPASQLTSAATA